MPCISSKTEPLTQESDTMIAQIFLPDPMHYVRTDEREGEWEEYRIDDP